MDVRFQQGLTFAALGHYQLAISHFDECLSLIEIFRLYSRMVKPLVNLAHIYAACGEFAQAQHQLERASALAETISDAAAIQQAEGDLALRRGQVSMAHELYHLSMEKLRRLNQLTAAQQALLKIGIAYVGMNRSDQGQEALDAVEADRLPVSLRWGYHTLSARLAASNRQPEQAVAEYVQALKQISQVRHVLLDQDLIQHFVRANERVFVESLQLALSISAFESALEIVELAAPGSGRLAPGGETTRIASARRSLCDLYDDGWTIIRYAWLNDGPEKELIIFILTKDGLECERIRLSADERLALTVCSDSLNSLRQEAYRHIDKSGKAKQKAGSEFLRTLFQALIPASVRARLHPDALLAIVPSGDLYGLAFQALLDDEVPLIAKTRLVYAPSLASLDASLATRPAAHALRCGQVLAQSTFEQPGYAALPFVEAEKEALLSGKYGEASDLPGGQLNRETLNAMGRSGALADYDWLHLATHAYIDSATHEYTGLLFGRDVIGSEDLAQWRLAEDVVSIAACQSGLARWGQSDDVAGIARAILTAGARSVIASQWSVDDENSCQLITGFYDQLAEGATVCAALAAVQRKAHADGMAAYVWATFCAYGHP